MDNKTLVFAVMCGIGWMLYQIERRLASFENRLVVSVQGQTQVLADMQPDYVIEMDDGDDE